MGCHLSQLRASKKDKWSTPIKPFDRKRVPEELKKAKNSNKKPFFWKVRSTKKVSKKRSKFDWWMSKSRRIRVAQITVKPSSEAPTINSSNCPRVTTIRPKAARPQRPYPIRNLPLPDVEERRKIPWVKPEGIQVNLPPVPTGRSSIDEEFEALFTYPDPILQDIEEPTLQYGQYSNQCPTRGGVAFDLVFNNEERPMTAKPVLSTPGRTRRRTSITKAELNRKQIAAAQRREENKQKMKKKMQEQAALDKFMKSQLAKEKKENSKREEMKKLLDNEEVKVDTPPKKIISSNASSCQSKKKTTRIIIKSAKKTFVDMDNNYVT